MEGNKKSSVIGTFEGKCCDSNVFNNNDMHLPKELFSNLFASEEYKNAMKNRYYIGYLGHPEDPNCMDFRNACIVMTDCYIDDAGEVYGKFDLVDTPVGQVVKSFIDAGVTFGISIRGAGDIDGSGEVDPETFVFRGFDLVTFPAYDDCVPEFQAIAASSDINKKVKYKKVCAAVKKNLTKITSCEALEIIQSQFKDGSEEYCDIEKRKDEIVNECNAPASVDEQKIDGLTSLFLEVKKENDLLKQEIESLKCQLVECQMSEHDARVECSRKIESFKRIVANQTRDLRNQVDSYISANESIKRRLASTTEKLTRMTDNYNQAIQANSKLVGKVKDLEKSNLKYCQQIEANSKTISQKESIISDLESNLRETVTASTRAKKEASNLDENVRSLQRKVEAAEQMVLDYQEAYANMYANALGVRISNLSIDASTSVEELRKTICSKTLSPDVAITDSEFEDVDCSIDDDETVTM